jgi:hypothetical protein
MTFYPDEFLKYFIVSHGLCVAIQLFHVPMVGWEGGAACLLLCLVAVSSNEQKMTFLTRARS